MSTEHDLALAFDALAETVRAQKLKLEVKEPPAGDPKHQDWQDTIDKLSNSFDELQDAATQLDTAYAAERLAGLQDKLESIQGATADANATIAKIKTINDVLHLVAAAVAVGAAVAATIANPVVGAPTLIASGNALVSSIDAYNKDHPARKAVKGTTNARDASPKV